MGCTGEVWESGDELVQAEISELIVICECSTGILFHWLRLEGVDKEMGY